MASVGMDMYLELLAETIAELKGEKARPKIEPEVNLQLQAYIPKDYVPDVNQRLVLYRRIASTLTDEESREIEEEMPTATVFCRSRSSCCWRSHACALCCERC